MPALKYELRGGAGLLGRLDRLRFLGQLHRAGFAALPGRCVPSRPDRHSKRHGDQAVDHGRTARRCSRMPTTPTTARPTSRFRRPNPRDNASPIAETPCTGPTATIDSKPANPTKVTSASFTYHSHPRGRQLRMQAGPRSLRKLRTEWHQLCGPTARGQPHVPGQGHEHQRDRQSGLLYLDGRHDGADSDGRSPTRKIPVPEPAPRSPIHSSETGIDIRMQPRRRGRIGQRSPRARPLARPTRNSKTGATRSKSAPRTKPATRAPPADIQRGQSTTPSPTRRRRRRRSSRSRPIRGESSYGFIHLRIERAGLELRMQAGRSCVRELPGRRGRLHGARERLTHVPRPRHRRQPQRRPDSGRLQLRRRGCRPAARDAAGPGLARAARPDARVVAHPPPGIVATGVAIAAGAATASVVSRRNHHHRHRGRPR